MGADSVKIMSWKTYTLPPLANAIYTYPFSTAFRLIIKHVIRADYMKTFCLILSFPFINKFWEDHQLIT